MDALVAATEALVVGDPTDPETDVGPVVHLRQLDQHVAAVEEARAAGARVVRGGARIGDGLEAGIYMAPTILDHVEPDASVARQEVFGPVLAVLDAPDFEAAVELTNDTAYGLTASVYTRDLHRAVAFGDRVDVGVVKINEPPTGLDPHVPTGGMKDSGLGHKELGADAFGFFSESKTIYLNYFSA